MSCPSCRSPVASLTSPCPTCGGSADDRFLVRAIPERTAYFAGTDPHVRCLVKVAARNAPASSSMGLHVLLALDVSASMNAPDKYPLLRQAVRMLVDRLPSSARLTLVLFAREIHVPLAAFPRAEISGSDAVDSLDASRVKFGNATLLGAGLAAVKTQAASYASKEPRGIQRLYVMTDGLVHDPEVCTAQAQELQNSGIEVRSFGFGEEFDHRVLQTLTAGPGGAGFRRIMSGQALEREFARAGEHAGRVAFAGMELQLSLQPGVLPGEVVRYRPSRQRLGCPFAQDRSAVLPIGSLEADGTAQFLVEVRIPPGPAGPFPWGELEVRHREGEAVRAQKARLFVTRTTDPRAVQHDPEVAAIVRILEPVRDPRPGTNRESVITRAVQLAREGRDSDTLAALLRADDDLRRGATFDALAPTLQAAVSADSCSEVLDLAAARLDRLRVAARLLADRPEAARLQAAVETARRALENGAAFESLPADLRERVSAILRDLGLE